MSVSKARWAVGRYCSQDCRHRAWKCCPHCAFSHCCVGGCGPAYVAQGEFVLLAWLRVVI
jgi:hypothetical protein